MMNVCGSGKLGVSGKPLTHNCSSEKASYRTPSSMICTRLVLRVPTGMMKPSSGISFLNARNCRGEYKGHSLASQISLREIASKAYAFQELHSPRVDDRGDHCTSYEEAFSNRYWELVKCYRQYTLFFITSIGDLKEPYFNVPYHSVNILCGVGILSVPFALKEGGWASLGVLGLLWCCTRYTAKILGRCQEMGDYTNSNLAEYSPTGEKSRLETYEDIGEAAFGKLGRNFISMVLYIELIGTCGLFYILAGDHLQSLFGGNSEIYMFLSAGLMIPSLWLEDLEEISKLGILGMVSTAILVGILGLNLANHPFFAHTAVVHPHSLPITFGLLAFVFAGHAVFPSIYSSMREPQKYEEMIDNTYVVVGLISLAVGVLGYGMYGSHTMEEITMNLPDGALRTLGTGLIVVNPFTKFALTMNPVGNALDKALGFQMGTAPSKMSRSGLGVLSLILATSVPYFAYFMSLIGSFLTVTVSILFPSLCYLKLKQRPDENSLSSSEILLNSVILAFGLFCATSGTYQTLSQLYDKVQ